MTSQEKQVSRAFSTYWKAHFSRGKGAFEKVLSLWHPDITAIGTGEDEIVKSYGDFKKFLKREFKEVNTTMPVKILWTKVQLQKDEAVVLGETEVTVSKENNIKIRFRVSAVFKKQKNKWLLYHIHGSLPASTQRENESFPIDGLIAEKEKLKKEVAEKTADLLDKNRELEIEAGLERVRARGMAMQTSEELRALIGTLFTELTKLDLVLTRCVIWIIDHKTNDAVWWMANSEDLSNPMSYLIPNHKKPPYLAFLKEWKKRTVKWVYDLKGQTKKNWDDHLFAKTELSKMPKFIRDGMRAPNRILLSASFSNFGGMNVASLEPLSDEHFDILLRFAKVFDLTYTRFNDLKKAEAQARESEIQLALERVRARTMAMHKSEELSETSFVLFKQLKELGEQAEQLSIMIYNEPESLVELYATIYGSQWDETGSLPFDKSTVQRKIFRAWKEQQSSIVIDLAGKDLKDFNKYKMKYSTQYKSEKDLPQNRWVLHNAFFSKGVLIFSSNEPRPPETIHLLERFAGVFDLTYTRFLDLQKAEAQARGAQIEASLERVRARTEAMHKSAELVETSDVLFQEIEKLGIEAIRTGVALIDGKKNTVEVWSRSEMRNQPENRILGIVPASAHPMYAGIIKAWKEKKPYYAYNLEGDNLVNYYKELTSYLSYPKRKKFNKRETIATYFFPEGSLNVISHEPLNIDQNNIMIRFAKVFGQLYRRFLDLQKAEAQARESEIQLALERVRARTMAMHKSGELSETSFVLFQQFVELGIVPNRFFIGTINEEESIFNVWITKWGGKMSSQNFPANIEEPILWKKVYKAWKANDKSLVVDISGEDLIKWNEYLEGMGSDLIGSDKSRKSVTRIVNTFAIFSKGFIAITTPEVTTRETVQLLERFASVFDGTYRRFLDLQKAEAQAREAQIEAALEKVRSRSLAMHKSDELQEVVNTVFERLKDLEIDMNVASIFIFKEGSKDWEQWVATSTTNYSKYFHIPYTDNLVFRDLEEAKQKRNNFYSVRYSLKQKNEWFSYAFKNTEYSQIPDDRKKYILESKFFLVSFALSKHSGIQIAKYEGKDFSQEENEILKRFSRVFEQAYIRFLDLQKAEAQARESEIQLALERVRARTMAMQHSEELSNMLSVMFEQFDVLEIMPVHTFLSLMDLENNLFSFRMTGKAGHRTIAEQLIDLDASDEWSDAVENFKKGKPDQVICYRTPVENVAQVFEIFEEILQKIPPKYRPGISDYPNGQFITQAYHQFGYLGFAHNREATEEEKSILVRLANEFNRSYRRFLDLQNAEAQAREAEIELGLERVRARAMAMQHSVELSDLVDTVFKELTKLDFALKWCIINIVDEPSLTNTVWAANPDIDKPPESYHMKFEDYPFHHAMMKGYQQRKTKYVYILEGEEKKIYDEYLFKDTEFRRVPAAAQAASKAMEKYVVTFTFSNFGGLQTVGDSPLSEASIDILSRFGKVFDLTYTRFNDLRLAEAQAREAQIEAALERVRSKTMGMQRSDELQDAAMLLFQQIEALSVPVFGCGFNIWDDDRKAATAWMAGKDRLQPPFKTSSSENIFLRIYDAAQKGETLFVEEQAGEALKTHYEYMNTIPVFKEISDKMAKAGQTFPTFQIIHCAFFSHGYLMFISFEPVPSAYDIFKRFAKVFEQTYIRFLDLQKAEAQAREAQIEAALERVRSRTMAMQKSEDLNHAASDMFKQIQSLGMRPWACGFNIFDKDEKAVTQYMSLADGGISPPFRTPLTEDPFFINIYNARQRRDELLVWESKGESLAETYRYMFGLPGSGEIFGDLENSGFEMPKFQITHCAYFSHGYLVFITYEQVPEAHHIFKRFAKVFEQTYIRFLDLQKAEAQAKEAIKQASLDRVRGEIASMRTSEDLNRITPVIWRELKALEVPFFRCGVFIVDEDRAETQVYLTTPDGKSLGVLNLSTEANALTKNSVDNWKRNQIYREHWNKEDFINWTKSMMKLGQVQNPETYQGSSQPPESLHLHFVPFAQGMLYVGNVAPLDEEKLELTRTLAEAFSIAYARYEDFKNLEEAKAAIENTLKELKSTQAQLVHSEKMASLGELTAGIAHEIKNPLNFVNNFSEVSSELIDEMMEELEKGNNEDVLDIVKDLKQNLEKINNHGKRADSIVKGMLLHSRGTAGEKAPTDINDLLEQYVNLAYHGMRAQNKDFNITIERDYDKTLEKINVVPQDISRVFLNIINNGCYAATDKKKTAGNGFSPTIKVSTKNLKDKVEIRIKDNGNGIPDKIKDKLFQPFFTTKPTGEGTGLGLSLSYDIVVKQHSGEIKVDSREGEETEFIIIIPKL